MGSAVGAIKIAAKRIGLSTEEYLANIGAGMKWCTNCRRWINRNLFGRDHYRGDGLKSHCITCCRVPVKRRRILSAPSTSIHNAATNAVRTAIRRGQLPDPRKITCVDCAGKAAQYHHDKGYEKKHWLDVIPVCLSCHQKRHWENHDKN